MTRIQRWIGLAALAAAGVATVGCTPPVASAPEIPEDYAQWRSPTDTVLDYPVPGHLDHFRKIFVNDVGTRAEVTQVDGVAHWNYPPGTMFVKEVYAAQKYEPDAECTTLTVMLKDPSHPDAKDGWVYLVKDMKTGVTRTIGAEYCFRCHQGANVVHAMGEPGNPSGEWRDYIFFPYLGD